MKNKVSLLVSTKGLIPGLVKKLIKALRERGVTDAEIYSHITENGNAFIGKIADVVTEFVKHAKNVYVIYIDYAVSMEELVRRGKYNRSNDDITTNNFPTKRSGKADLVIELIHFNRNIISSEDAITELDKMGLRPAEGCELLVFGEKYPDVQREFPIAALGSVWREWGNYCSVVCLAGGNMRRDVDRAALKEGWSKCWRFAAFRK